MSQLPTWEGFMIPVLAVLADGETRSLRELRRGVADHLDLDEGQREEALPSGGSRAENRTGWAVTYLHHVDALARPRRGHYAITDVGRTLLIENPDGLRESDLAAIAREGDEWWSPRRAETDPGPGPTESTTPLDPIELIEQGIAGVEREVASELLRRLRGQDPAFFEAAVVKLLLAMGYGGIGGRGVPTARSNDGGIDGIIDQDVLGLSKVYVQAKRYAEGNPVQRPEVQGFVGALTGRADSGVFITTSRFSVGAREWADRVPTRIILVDGSQLVDLMIEYGVGVQVHRTYRVVEIDEDFFE